MTAKKPVAFSIPSTTMDYVRERASEMGVSNTMYLTALIVKDIVEPISLAEVNLYGSVGKTQQVGMTLRETVRNVFPGAKAIPSPAVAPPSPAKENKSPASVRIVEEKQAEKDSPAAESIKPAESVEPNDVPAAKPSSVEQTDSPVEESVAPSDTPVESVAPIDTPVEPIEPSDSPVVEPIEPPDSPLYDDSPAEPLPMPPDAPYSESRIEEELEKLEGDKPHIKWSGQI